MGKVDENQGSQGHAPGTVIDGRYKVVRFIGSGGNGLVHEVEHVLTGRRLALKSLHDDTGYGRLEQEARATSLMKNGHAVKVTDMGVTGTGSPYIVMELLEGQSLRTLLDDTGQLPLELTVNIALQVCECLAEAHQHGIVHRDLKPDNIFLCQGALPGQHDVKVLDFGVVKIAQDGPIPNASLTRTGSTVGTPFYMSLEQLRNSSAVDHRGDIYSLGVVLYESLSGRKPFQAETIGDLVYALCAGPPTHLSRLRPDLPVPLCEIVMRALAVEREKRQASMSELATDLLPFGDAAFGVWLRPEGGRRPLPSHAPATVTSPVHHTPSGVKPPPVAEPAPAKPVATPAAGAKPAGPGRAALDEDDEPRTTVAKDPRNAPPDGPATHRRDEASGDRDTPTEMYVKSVHRVGTPLAGTPAYAGAAHDEAPAFGPTGDRDTPTRALEAARPRAGNVAEQGAAGSFAGAGQPIGGNLTPGSHDGRAPAGPALGAPASHDVNAVSYGSMGPPSFGSASLAPGRSLAPGSARPSWQHTLDRWLASTGGVLERWGRTASRRFRAASPRAQIAVVVAAASLFAALVVFAIWLLLT